MLNLLKASGFRAGTQKKAGDAHVSLSFVFQVLPPMSWVLIPMHMFDTAIANPNRL